MWSEEYKTSTELMYGTSNQITCYSRESTQISDVSTRAKVNNSTTYLESTFILQAILHSALFLHCIGVGLFFVLSSLNPVSVHTDQCVVMMYELNIISFTENIHDAVDGPLRGGGPMQPG